MNHPAAPARRAPGRAAPDPRRVRGFTLIELAIVVAIVGTMVSMAAPSLTRLADSVRLTGASNSLLSSLRLARSEARKRGDRVLMCKSADGLVCTTAGGWEQGWILFQDRNASGGFDEGDTVIQVQQALPGRLSITGNRPVASAIAYSPIGVSRGVSGAMLSGTITLCRRSLEPVAARQIVISSGGRPRVKQLEVDHCG